MAKLRIDLLLVQRGLCESRAKAHARIMAGDVLVADRPVTKAGALVPEEAAVRLRGEALPFVSRGGLKLDHALTQFGLDPAGWVCFDAGASRRRGSRWRARRRTSCARWTRCGRASPSAGAGTRRSPPDGAPPLRP